MQIIDPGDDGTRHDALTSTRQPDIVTGWTYRYDGLVIISSVVWKRIGAFWIGHGSGQPMGENGNGIDNVARLPIIASESVCCWCKVVMLTFRVLKRYSRIYL